MTNVRGAPNMWYTSELGTPKNWKDAYTKLKKRQDDLEEDIEALYNFLDLDLYDKVPKKIK